MSAVRLLETLWQDLRYALRAMRKNPAFAATAVLTIALGIGGNTAIFTVVRAVLLKPLEYRDPDRLLRLSVDNLRQNLRDVGFSRIRYEEMRASAQSFTELGVFFIATENVTLSGGDGPEALKAARVSANFLRVLGVAPALGRSFLPEEDAPGAPPVAMISAELWQRRFGGDPFISGKTATLDSTPHTIAGVLPAGFQFPLPGLSVWLARPSEYTGLPPREWPNAAVLIGFGRVKPQVSLEQARAELEVLSRQYAAAHPGPNANVTMRVEWLRDHLVANVRPALWTLFGAVGFVLLIACGNLASLLLARASARSREFAVRVALGAARGRLIGQLLAESLALSLAGGALGVLLANWGLSAITRMNTLHLPRSGEIRLDGVVLVFTVALSVATGVVFGLFPALQVSRPDPADALRERAGDAGRSARRGPLGLSTRSLLVVGQVALSIVLLIGAGLLIQSSARLRRVNPGFQSSNLLTMQIALPPARYDTGPKRVAFFEELVRRVEALPGVRGAAAALTLPMTVRYASQMQIAEQPKVALAERPQGQLQSVTSGYFRTLGIPLRRGREFTARDIPGAPPAVIINESLARRFWPAYPRGEDPVGRHLLIGAAQQGGHEIAGIVADVHESSLDSDTGPEMYLPLHQKPPQTAGFAVRTETDPQRSVNAIRSQVLEIDRDQPVLNVRTMDEAIEASLGQRRLTMALLGVFAGLAMLLAVVGIYGVIAYAVVQRTREVGIRRALGAQPGNILRLIACEGLGLTAAGVVLGIGGAFALTRLIKGLLFHVSATDPSIFAGIALLFVIVALAASYIPARRAARIDPAEALR
jgi:putative ABC transport system permease protein